MINDQRGPPPLKNAKVVRSWHLDMPRSMPHKMSVADDHIRVRVLGWGGRFSNPFWIYSFVKIQYKLPEKWNMKTNTNIVQAHVFICTFNRHEITLPHCSKVSEQLLSNSVLTLSGTSNNQLMDTALSLDHAGAALP